MFIEKYTLSTLKYYSLTHKITKEKFKPEHRYDSQKRLANKFYGLNIFILEMYEKLTAWYTNV